MAQNIFNATFDANNRIDVNSFDWSHINNLTTDFGRITPVFCKLVPAKGSVRINPEFGLELMPMVFPVQTRMFARLNFFKVPLRTLWDDYRDFVGNFRDDLEEPYIGKPSTWTKLFSQGGLADYLDFPTQYITYTNQSNIEQARCSDSGQFAVPQSQTSFDTLVTNLKASYSSNLFSCQVSGPTSLSNFMFRFKKFVYDGSNNQLYITYRTEYNNVAFARAHLFVYNENPSGGAVGASLYDVEVSPSQHLGSFTVSVRIPNDKLVSGSRYTVALIIQISASSSIVMSNSAVMSVNTISLSGTPTESTFPFAQSSSSTLPRLRAYRVRAYEACYNAYYRDIRNNPFVVNGKPVYNKWLPSTGGGIDSYPYDLHICNWEKDAYTTAVPNPQQGQTPPLVGLVTGDVITMSEDGERVVQKQVVLSTEDGGKYGLKYKTNEDGTALTGVEYEPLSDKTPVTAINSYNELATLATQAGSGFTIETLRYVNAYQKFLELNMRKGFSYKQIMEGRFDVNIKFDELLMPEFIGGVSRELSMRTVEQTVDQQTENSQGKYAEALGSKTGIAGVYGYSDNSIECFCDEECIVIGLLTVVPVPIYSQLLPKDWLYDGLLDHFQPEFDRIGFQPITYKELCPLNTIGNSEADTNARLNAVFGYQRPWHEYVSQYDTSHGSFRGDMSSFIMQRTFKDMPQLGKEFLLVDNETVNQVFAVTEFTDKIFGYVKFNCTARLPISRVAIPRLD